MGKMHDMVTAVDLSKELGISVERVGQKFRAFRDGKHPHFSGPFNRVASLTPVQVAYLRGEVVEPETETKESDVTGVESEKVVVGRPDRGPSKVMAPETVTAVKKRTLSQKLVLAGVCVLCATASVSNMLEVSLQIKEVFWVAAVFTAIFTVAPFAVFYADVPPGVSWFVSGICIFYEVFCNSVGIYRGFANLGQGVPYEVWEPGGFIDSISRVTTLEARPCALAVSGAMAALVASLFLVCLIELKK